MLILSNCMQVLLSLLSKKRSFSIGLIVLLLILPFIINLQQAQAALITSSSVQMGDSRTSSTNVTYKVGFTFPSTSAVQCIIVKFGTTSGLGTQPTAMTSASGFTLTGGGLTQGNWTNYGTNNGFLQIDAGSNQTPTATAATITWTGVTNTSTSGVFFAQITSYATNTSHTCTGQVDQSNVMAITTTAGVTATVSVDPSVSFTVANYGSAVNGSGDTSPITTTATTVPFGTVAGGATAWGSHTLTVGTNAAHGYDLYVRDTQSLTDSNSDTIRDQACASSNCTVVANAQTFDGSTTQSSLAYTGDNANKSFTSNKWLGFTTTNTDIASLTTATASDVTHVEYKVQISNAQQPGTYSTVIVYTITPTY
jgi:hypothetical protein